MLGIIVTAIAFYIIGFGTHSVLTISSEEDRCLNCPYYNDEES